MNEIIKELKKYGLIGIMLGYFLYQDSESRKIERRKTEGFTETIKQIGITLKEDSHKINSLTIDTKLNAKDIQILDSKIIDIEEGL